MQAVTGSVIAFWIAGIAGCRQRFSRRVIHKLLLTSTLAVAISTQSVVVA